MLNTAKQVLREKCGQCERDLFNATSTLAGYTLIAQGCMMDWKTDNECQ